jgi:Fur family iron response transcriptional regulator
MAKAAEWNHSIVLENTGGFVAKQLHLGGSGPMLPRAYGGVPTRHFGEFERFMTQPRTLVFSSAVPSLERGSVTAPRAALNGCPWHDVKAMLREVGLRPTRQRMALGWILFGKGDRHITAEMLYEEASKAKVPVSLATVYNTLHQFTEVGLLRQVAVDGSKTYFDTNASEHHHFFVEGESNLLDIPDADMVVGKMPTAPEGYEITRIDVVVRLRRKPVIGGQ